MPARSVGAARIVIGGSILMLLVWRRRRPWAEAEPAVALGHRGRLGLLTAGALVALYQTAFFSGLDRAGVAVGTVVTIGSGPIFAGALGTLAGQGRPRRAWFMSTSVAVAGIVLLADPFGVAIEPAGIGLALTSGFGYAGYTVVAKSLVDRGVDGQIVVSGAFGIGGLLLLPVLVSGPLGWLTTWSGGVTALYLGVLPTALAYVLYARGLRSLQAATITTIVLLEPVVAAVLGVAVLDERLVALQVLGCVVVLGALASVARADDDDADGAPPTGDTSDPVALPFRHGRRASVSPGST